MNITATDMFCGAGGSTTGATLAGVEVKLALNHWSRAIETHNTNHPQTLHACVDLHKEDPRRFLRTDILMASPECTAHTIAKGARRTGQGQPSLWEEGPSLEREAEERSRCTMYTPLIWAECWNYRAVILENVVDAHLWAPFPAWLQAWKCLGYEFEIVYLNSMFAHPTPQSRDRMYFVAWKRGQRKPDLKITPLAHCAKCSKDISSIQSWKNPTRKYGKYRQQYVYVCPSCANEVTPHYYPASSAIDWSITAQRIGDRKKPLTAKTTQRIADGIKKFASNPFVLDHLGEYRPRDINAPLSTICAGGNHQSLVFPRSWLMTYYQHGAMVPVSQSIPTVTTLERHALVIDPDGSPDISDCGFRMLLTNEIQAAMAFPKDYILTGNKKERVKMLGNAVTPPVMKLLMQRVVESLS